ncbi:MAG: hypothetical protein R3Y63_15405 [Eubacteriales bacterium]
MNIMANQSLYFTNMLMIRDLVKKNLMTNKEADFVALELAKDYEQEPVFLW